MNPRDIDFEAHLIEHCPCDELDVLEIIQQISVEFNIEIPEGEVLRMPGGITVKNLSIYVNKRIQ